MRLAAAAVVLACLALAPSAHATIGTCNTAGPIEVEATGAGPGPIAYATLGAAFAAINAGTHTGTVTIEVCGNSAEGAATAVLNASGSGPASYTSISIKPVGGFARTISGATAAGNPLIDLNGADNVTIEGVVSAGNSLTIANTTVAGAGTATLRFINGATGNVVSNTNLQGSFNGAVTTNGGTIYFAADGTTGGGNDGNTIVSCNILPAGSNLPTKAVYGSGTTTSAAIANSGNVINGNNIYDYFGAAVASAGIYLGAGNTAWTITNNRFYQTATRTWTTGANHRAIEINNTLAIASGGAQGFTITGNTIGFSSFAGTGTYALTGSDGKFAGIYFAGADGGTATSISNNTIAALSMTGVTSSGTSTSSPFVAILPSNGVVNTNGNVIGSQGATGSLVFATNTAGSTEVYGIFNFGFDNWTANANQIGGLTVDNAGTAAMVVYLLRANTSTAKTFGAESNLIGGTVADSIQNNATGAGSQLIGIATADAAATFTSNVLRNLSGADAIIGLLSTASSTNHVLQQNSIYTLRTTGVAADASVSGIQFTGATGTNVIARNKIQGLSATTGTGAITGIGAAGGTATYQNNMIDLGNGVTAAAQINGINESGGTNNFFHNSVYVGGSPAAGSTGTFAFSSTVTTNTRSYRDNIFVNARTNGGGTGQHYAIRVGGTTANPAGLTTNNNVLRVSGAGGLLGQFNGVDRTLLSDWQAATGQDGASFSSDPRFLDPANAATPDLHIHPTQTTVIEGNGFAVGTVDDYDGQARGSFTPVDIGADAGNFAGMDLTPPVIAYTPLATTVLTSSRTLSTTITDAASGVPTSGSGRPVIYFRKGASGSYASKACTAGVVGAYNCVIDYNLVAGGSVASGDTIQYWVAAEDGAATPNVTSNPSTGASGFTANPPNATTPTAAPSAYRVVVPLSGTASVCASGCTYASLTNAGGVFADINARLLNGNLSIEIQGDLNGETGAVSLNPIAEEPIGNYTVKIYPVGAPRTVTGTGTGATLVSIVGADRVTIDGSLGGAGTDRSLTFNQTNTASGTGDIFIGSQGIGNGATNVTIANCIIRATIGTSANFTFGVFVGDATGAAAGADNDNFTFRNNQVLRARTGLQMVGDVFGPNDNAVISGNTFGDGTLSNSLGRIGLSFSVATNATISGNTIENIFIPADTSSTVGLTLASLTGSTVSHNTIEGVQTTANATCPPFGMLVSGSSGVTISDNTIDGVVGGFGGSGAGDVYGLALKSGFMNSTVTRNMIRNVSFNGTGGYGGRGLDVNTGIAASNLTITNNMIANVEGDGWNDFTTDSIAGIRITGATGGLKLYFNSVNLGSGSFAGNGSGTRSAALAIGASATALDVRDNIFATNLVNANAGTAKSYAAYTEAVPAAFATVNYNDYIATGTQGILGHISGVDMMLLAGWRTSTLQDMQSLSAVPGFVSSTDLHLDTGGGATPVENAGFFLAAVPVDFDGDTRHPSLPGIGADEVRCHTAVDNCDDGDICTVDSCNPSTGCLNTPGNAGATCRPSAGICDVAETCNGTSPSCPANAFQLGTECRAPAGLCDVAELCSGASALCPADVLVASGTTCRPSTGVCDVAETCTGSSSACPADVLVASGTTCRPSTGACDPAEACNGSSGSCPADVFAGSNVSCTGVSQGGACDDDTADHCSGTTSACLDAYRSASFQCRASAGACDVAESCTGSSGSCPADGFASSATLCTGVSQGGGCDNDAADHCSGTANTCVDAYRSAGFQCRASAGPCDVAESCTGSSGSCPANVFAPSSVGCTGVSQGGACDNDAADHCTGVSNVCVDVLRDNTFTCRGAAGLCDAPETCTGSSSTCPADVLVTAGTTCRPSTGGCDPAEACTGASPACPADVFATSGASCTGASQGGACDDDPSDHCSGIGTCVDAYRSAGFECRASASACDVAESCTGSSGSCPADVFAPSSVGCTGVSQGGVCDNDTADHCSGTSSACLDGYRSAGFECRASAGACDAAENCTGSSGSCPADGFASSATLCTGVSQGGACDNDAADHCSGTANTCVDALRPSGFQCRASAGPCDVAETCTGSSASCPANAFAGSSVSCTGTSQGGACDNDAADHCTGVSNACVDVLRDNTFTCRGAAGLCDVPELCTGSSSTCPADVLVTAGTTCRSSTGACDPAEACTGASPACPANVTTGPVDVLSTTGSAGGVSTAYPTLGAAFTAINAGVLHRGAITISLCGSTDEGTTPATLNSSGAGSASYTSILIRPITTGITIVGNPAGGFGVIQLNGADNVTIDGDDPNSAGINRNLTVTNTASAATTAGSVIRIATSAAVTSADNDTIKNCVLNGNVTGGNAAGITSAASSSGVSFGVFAGGGGGATAAGSPVAVTTAAGTSAPAGTTINALLIDNNAVNQAARAVAFNGAGTANSTSVTVTNNVIGAAGTPTPAYPSTSPSTTVYGKGVVVQGATAVNVSNNTIRNVISYVGIAMAGLELTANIGAGPNTLSGNTIAGVLLNAAGAFSARGVSVLSSAGIYTVGGNTISNIENSCNSATITNQPNGIFVATAAASATIENNAVTTVVDRNSGTLGVAAVHLNGGNNITFRNNVIADVNEDITAGAAFSTTNGIHGLRISAGNGHKIYHNSINLFGATLGASSTSVLTSAFTITATGLTGYDVRNNIFANRMTGGSTSVAHVATCLPASGTAGNMSLTWNNNAYYTGSTAGVHGVCHVGTVYTAVPAGGPTFAGLYTAANFAPGATTPTTNFRAYTSTLLAAGTNDNQSLAFATAAPFTTSTDLHISTGLSITPLESHGASVGVLSDIDGDVRPGPAGSVNGGATAPDLGADEFDGVPPIVNDLQATAFIDPLSGSTKIAGVPFSPQASFTNNGIGTPANATVRYRIISGAVDVYNNTQVIPSILPGVTTTVTFASTSIAAGSYSIEARAELSGDQVHGNDAISGTLATEAPLCGSYDVGAGGDFVSLTNAGGAFAKLNLVGASCDVVFNIISDLTGETGSSALGAWAEYGAGGYHLLVKPSGVARSISGDSTTAAVRALIELNGADRVTIDGSLATPSGSDRSLTITNADAGTASAVINVSSGAAGAQNDTFINLVVVGNSNTTTFLGIGFGGASVGSAGTDNDNNRVENCDIRKTQYGIATSGASVANKNTGNVITKNLLNNSAAATRLGSGGILASFEDGIEISDNAIGGINSAGSADVFGISLGGLTAWGNTTTTGGSEVTNARVLRNNIGIVRQSNRLSAAGIVVTPATSGTSRIANNFISGVITNARAPDFGAGIFLIDSGTDSTTQIYFNSISLSGSVSGADQPQYALAVNGSNPTLDVRNNILRNVQSTGGANFSYAIGLGYSAFTNLTSNNNDLFVTATGNFKIGRTVNISSAGGTDQTTLLNWQSATGKDAASKNVAPNFVSDTDLHLDASGAASTIENAAVPLAAVTDDIDGDLRHPTTPDIGAHELRCHAAVPSELCDDLNPCTVDSCNTVTGCVNTPGNAGATCRASAGACDVAETCTGSSAACPADAFASSATLCTGTSQGGACDRDVADHCSGTANTCVDVFRAAGFQCRASAGACDVPETCTGSSSTCPADAFASSATLCTGVSEGGACDDDAADHCSGAANTCLDAYRPAGFECRASAGACDSAETCTGATGSCPADVFASAATPCTGASQGGACDNDAADHCVGNANTCVDVLRPSGFQCRASAGACDVAETCTGSSSSCPADAFAASSASCTGASQGGGCDNDAADHCSGTANTCVDVFRAAGFQCRASTGTCDVAETCTGSSGSCPADGFAASSVSCTGASQGGACDNDAADHCTGTNSACVDVYRSAGLQCRAAAGTCDVAESCTGSSGSCPADGFASSATLCTGASQGGACDNDAADHCSGTANTCVDALRPSGFQCRASAGACDVAETCSGSSSTCPSDVFASAATLCTGASQGGACDNDAADHCSGTANTCVDALRPSGFQCRASAGACDVAETCSGSSSTCPSDVFASAATLCTGTSQGGACDNDAADHCSGTANTCVDALRPSGFQCRASAGTCDVAETCTGSSSACPADVFASSATLCTGTSQGGACDNDAADHCSGTANACVDAYRSASFECRASAGACDSAETCTGASGSCPADVFASSATLCTGVSQGGACDNDAADHCSGTANACLDVYRSAGSQCRASAGACDVAESCTGSSGSCPADLFAASSVSCTGGSQGGACDNDAADHCSGTANACVDVYRSASFECRAPAGACDVAELCSGSSGACPADAFAASSVSCTGGSQGGACDNDTADHCSGTANACVDVYRSAGLQCRAAAGTCDVAEACTGSSGACPADLFASSATLCTGASQGGACDNDAADHCSGTANTCVDALRPSGFQCRASAGACDVAETCTGSSSTCPADVFASAATLCTGVSQGGACDNDTADHCSGTANTCVDFYRSAAFQCRGAAGPCDVAENCTGSSGSCPADGFASSATLCTGAAQGGACDNDAADHCSGTANTCVDVLRSAGFQCRAPAGQCDVAETCTGSSSTCPSDVFAASSVSCTGAAQGGACDNDAADHCSGTANACVDVFRPAGFQCRADAGPCDVAETCTGTSSACPADVFSPSSTACTGASQGGLCDNDAGDHCSGTANTCVDAYRAAGLSCRASAGACDVAETCTGTAGSCPADVFASAATLCTGTSQGGACDNDAADHCSGTANTCVDVLRPSGFQCRAPAGACDVAETCTGSSASCPADVFAASSVSCTGASQAGACDNDAADHCSGTANACVDVYRSAGFECRASAGACDVAESCTGSTGSCPADVFATASTLCTGAAQGGGCDNDAADHCSGTANTCVDVLRPSGFQCRASAGPCDVAETCTGSSSACPADAFAASSVSCTGAAQAGACDNDTADHCSGTANTCVDAYRPASFQCRASAGTCDVAETCTGSSSACPSDVFAASSTLCTGVAQGGACDNDAADHCSGTANTCVDAFRPASFQCRADAGQCDVAETCTGSSSACPPDVFSPSSLSCTGASQAGACDNDAADHCSGTANTCVDVYRSAAFQCRGSAGPCDVAETCTGSSGSCPADVFAASSVSCTGAAQGGGCDNDAADHCSGTANTCVDVLRPSGFQCRASAGPCDVAETCTGSSSACPADAFAASSVSCTGAAQAGACDNDAADHCSGTANTCVDVFRPASFQCRADAGQCDVAENCTGSSSACPPDVFSPSSVSCTGAAQGGACDNDAADHCSGTANACVDVFRPSSFQCRADAGQCDVAETCTGSSSACPPDVFSPSSLSCTGASQAGACDNDAADHCSGTANTCVDVYRSAAFQCRGSAGQCDVAETCTGSSGSCPADVFAASSVSCTGAAQGGACDNDTADHCSGTANTCVDAFRPASFECRADAGQCDVAENCTGSSSACPPDVFAASSTSCTGAAQGGACDNDAADHCSGTANTCVDAFRPASFTCRADAGQCDVAETCTGSSSACPADVFSPSSASCTGASQGGLCDHDSSDHCSGTANTCVDAYRGAGFQCRASAGQCDVAEFCTGSAGTCPTDAFATASTLCTGAAQGGACDNDAADHCSGAANTCVDVLRPSGFQCRASAGQCDVAETCTGSSSVCPVNVFAASSTACTGASQGGACDNDAADHCSGVANTCLDVLRPLGFECRASAGPCDVAEVCTGASGACPANVFAPSSTGCTGASEGGACDNDAADHCSGAANTCLDVLRSAGFECRASAGICDVPESCTGASASCPSDGFVPGGTECRGSAGDCDPAEACTGSSAACPSDVLDDASTVCREAVGTCDKAERCTGSDPACPPDLIFNAGDECRASAGICDVAESCDGVSGLCPADTFEPPTVECRGSTVSCDPPENCTGASASCPPDAVNQTQPVGATVTESAAGATTTITWNEVLAGPFNVYRGSYLAGSPFVYNHQCYANGVPGPSVTDATKPSPGRLWYYLISRDQPPCSESNLGQNRSGVDRPNPTPCGSLAAGDADHDGIIDSLDNCPAIANPSQDDRDGDGHGDLCDNCVDISNVDQSDADGDTVGDACDPVFDEPKP